ncbi:sugar ABC transporter substrate-binding protein [Mesorhizobium tianshanense]|nr:sugar ABC transporter substrate-binding protein [Mesorhizobium tianshanense]
MIPDSGSLFYTQAGKVSQPLLEQLGYTLDVLDAGNKAELQLNQIDNVINLAPKAIIIAAVDFDALVPGIEKARAAGIKVIAFDRPITNTPVDFTSIAGVTEIGAAVARDMAERIKQRKGSYAGKILQIMGDPGDNYAVQLAQGFDSVIAGYPDIEVTSKAAQLWEPTVAANIAQDYLTSQGDVDAIFYHSGYLAGAVVSVLEAMGKKPGDLIIVDGDGDPGAIAQIKAGWQQASIEAPLYAEAFAVAAFFENVVNGDKMVEGNYDILGIGSKLTIEKWSPTITIPGQLIDPANVDDAVHWGNAIVPDLKAKAAAELAVKSK